MGAGRNRPNLSGFIVIGCGLIAVAIATGTWGLAFGGATFIVIGVASVLGARKADMNERGEDGEGSGR